MSDIVAPHDLQAERALIGAVLVNNAALPSASTIVRRRDFFRDGHAKAFDGMLRLADRGIPIDLVTLKDELVRAGELDDVGGPAYLSSMADGVPRSANIEHYARIIKARSSERRALECLEYAKRRVLEGDVTQAISSLRSLGDDLPAAGDELLLEPIAAVATRVSTEPPRQLIRGLVPASGNVLAFGKERTFKSITAREIAAALASGRCPFGLVRLAVDDAVPVAYVTEEDGARDVLEHLDAFSDGRATAGELPIYLSAQRGLSLDDPRVQDRIVQQAKMAGAGLIVLEPLRSLTNCVDKGPGDLAPFVAFLRRLARDTGAALLLGHHEVKASGLRDPRKGGDRVSGGGLLSVCEAPIAYERLDESRVLLTPLSWKHFASPPAITVRLETENGRVRRIVGEEYTTDTATPEDHVRHRVLDVVRDGPGLSSSTIAAKSGGRKGAVLTMLHELERAGKIRSVDTGRATCWYPGPQGDQ